MKKITALVVLYNPKSIGFEKIVKNITSYSTILEKIYIVDNSVTDNSEILDFIKNAEYISNKNENGIAGAQNKGCQKALEDGYEWILTMDQDSSFEEGVAKEYISEVTKFSEENSNYKSFTPTIIAEKIPWNKWIRFNILSPIKRKVLGKRWKPKFIDKIEEKEKCIASGNIINLKVWQEVGGFDNLLFIDEVDDDFCYKLRKKEYKIARFSYIFLKHNLGEKKFSLLPRKLTYHNEFRMFYIIRNHYIMADRYPEYSDFYKKELKDWLYDFCINTIHPIKHYKIFKKAKNAYLEMKKNGEI